MNTYEDTYDLQSKVLKGLQILRSETTREARTYEVSEIQKLASSRGVELSHADAWFLWDKFSDSRAAGWLIVDLDSVECALEWAANQ